MPTDVCGPYSSPFITLFSTWYYHKLRSIKLILCNRLSEQSAKYILSPEFVSSYKKVDFNEACIMWRLIHNPTSATIVDIMKLVFTTTNMSFKSRYYVDMPPSTALKTPVSELPRESPSLKKPTGYENIKGILQSKGAGSAYQRPAVLAEEFDPVPEEIQFNIDTTATIQTDNGDAVPCAETVEEALFLVSKARQKAATHPLLSIKQIQRNVDFNGFEVFSIEQTQD